MILILFELWDLEQNSCVSSFEEHRQRVTSLHKIQDGNSMVLSGSSDNFLKVLKIKLT